MLLMSAVLYETRTPGRTLAGMIDGFWHYSDYHPAHAQELVLPSATVEIVILLTDRIVPGVRGPWEVPEGGWQPGWVTGPYARPFTIDTERQGCCMGAHVRLGQAGALFGIPVGELAGRHVGLSQIWGADADRLYDRLRQLSAAADRFALLEQALLDHLPTRPWRTSLIAKVLERLPILNETRIGRLRRHLGLSERHFIAHFHACAGLKPKQCERILRMQRALLLLRKHPQRSTVQVALDSGYCDQSHLHRDMQALCQVTPSAYRQVCGAGSAVIPLGEQGQIYPIAQPAGG